LVVEVYPPFDAGSKTSDKTFLRNVLGGQGDPLDSLIMDLSLISIGAASGSPIVNGEVTVLIRVSVNEAFNCQLSIRGIGTGFLVRGKDLMEDLGE